MLSRVETAVTQMSAGARGWRLSSMERSYVRDWLTPVEHVVRLLIVGEALIRFLMHGKIPKRPPPKPSEQRSTSIPHPGWHTIAKLWRPEPEPPPPPPPRPPSQRFRVLVWRLPRYRPPPSTGVPFRIINLNAPSLNSPVIETDDAPDLAAETIEPCTLGDRIARLARVIANPEPAIRRIASYFAKHLDAPTEVRGARFLRTTKSWAQGDLWFDQVLAQVRKAIAVWERHIEPG